MIKVEIEETVNKMGIALEKLSDLPNELSGFIQFIPESKSFEMLINSTHSPVRQRFTIAHELGHFVLHKDKIIERGRLNRGPKSDNEIDFDDRLEKEANAFAAGVLMPEAQVTHWYKILKPTDPVRVLDRMADLFEVSKDSMYWRLKNLRLVD